LIHREEESVHRRATRLRELNEGEKLSLIFTQQRKLEEYQERVRAFECAHQEGTCPQCVGKDQRIAELQSQIDELRREVFGRSSERRQKKKKRNGPGGSPQGKGTRARLPSEQFPDAQVVETTLKEETPPSCETCQTPMSDSGLREVSERLEYRPAEVYIHRTLRVKYGCKCCQGPLQSATLPERLSPGSHLGDSLILYACISKFYDLIPTTRTAKIMARGMTAVSHKLLLKAQSIMAWVLLRVYQEIGEEIKNSRVILADETIHRQLEENHGNWRWYLWGFSNARTGVYFEIKDTRAADVSIEFLKQAKAEFLISDAYTGYGRTVREINEIRQSSQLPKLQSSLCNDHSRRYWFKAQDVASADQVLDLYEKIYKIEAQVQKLLKEPRFEESQNLQEALKLRQTADPLFHQIHSISCDVLLESNEKSVEAVAARYFLNHTEELTLYLKHIELPISNAFTERSIRDAVVLRKVAMGNHSQEGAEEAAIQLSVMGSCKMIGVNPSEYLEWIRGRYLKKQPLLTPYQYQQQVELPKKTKPPDSS
jgi:transposase